MANTAKERQNYSYTRIADLKSGIYNVLGVVKFSKIPVRSRGPDLVQVLSITDETVTEKLVVSLFYSAAEYFPATSIGDVIRFHRLRVETIGGELKGRPGPGFSWLLVHDDVDSPTVSSKSYTYTDHTKQRVRELQKWAGEQSWMRQASMTSLCDLVPSQYCDLVCQVVGTVTERQEDRFVARVWDGTTCPYGVACIDEMMDMDPALEEQAGNLTVDVWIYDDHVASCQNIKPGQFIKLCNLHAAVHKEDDTRASDELPVLELVLHRGTAYGRGVVALNQQSPLVAVVKQRMDRCLSGEAAHEASEPTSEQACSSPENPADQLTQNQNDPAQTAATPVVCSKDQAQTAGNEHGTAASEHHHRESESPQPGCSRRVQNDDPQGHRQKGPRDHRKRKHGGGDHQKEEEDPRECCQKDGQQKDQYKNGDKRRPVQSAQHQPVCGSVSSTTSGTDKTGPSVTCTPQVCSSLGNKDNPVVISSSSLEHEQDPARNSMADCETGATADPQGQVGVSHHRTVECGEAASSGGGVGAGGKSGNFSRDTSCEDELSQVLLSSESGSGNKEMLQPSQQSSTENCMLQTASVITGHHHINRTPISDVMRHEVPSKFRVLAHLVDVYPDPSDPWQLVKQLCPKCFFLTSPQRETVSSTTGPGAASVSQWSMVKSATSSITSKLAGLLGGRFANWNPDILQSPEKDVIELCPQCKTGGERVPLELIYMLRLMLRDSKGDCLVANLWRDNAVTFFRGVSPELALHTEGRMEELVQSLRSLCVGRLAGQEPPSSLPPCLDCCLLSYTVGDDLNFHIFDTVLV